MKFYINNSLGQGRLSKKEKGLMDMDNSSDCWGKGGIRGLNGNGKTHKKDEIKKV